MSFQWFYWWLCISLRTLRLFSHVICPWAGVFRWSIATKGTIGSNRKMMSFQWFYWWLCISLRTLRLFSHVICPWAGVFRWSIATKGTIGTNRKIMSFQWFYWWICILDYFVMRSVYEQGYSSDPLLLIVRLVPIEKDVIPMILLVNIHLINVAWLGTGGFQLSAAVNGTNDPNRKWCESIDAIGEHASR